MNVFEKDGGVPSVSRIGSRFDTEVSAWLTLLASFKRVCMARVIGWGGQTLDTEPRMRTAVVARAAIVTNE